MPTESWKPSANLSGLRRRAELLRQTREFFADRNVLEVETPILGKFGVTEPHVSSISIRLDDEQMWLRTSPEYYMKRLLAAGSGDIFQIGKAFRDSERGSRHQPEFTMVEWYRQGFTLESMHTECCELIMELSQSAHQPVKEYRQHRYRDLCIDLCGIDPLESDSESLKQTALRLLKSELNSSLIASLGKDRQAWLDLLVSHIVYPALEPDKLHVVTGYPHDQAMLARLNPDDERVADRFEIFLNGLELANGFRELLDPTEQAKRFETDRERRQQLGKRDMRPDTDLLDALRAGLPDCCGVAVGLDRVLMTTDRHEHIETTMSFKPGN